jgi:protein-disulfide isomerase
MTTQPTSPGDAPATLPTSRGPKWRSTLDLTATLLVIVAALGMLWTVVRGSTNGHTAAAAPREVAIPAEPQSLDGAPVLGDPSAKVVIIEYSDFQCPYCGRFARETLPAFKLNYIDTGKVRLAFRNLPLESIHPLALDAAVAATCAERSSAFWAFHERVYGDQTKLDRRGLEADAAAVGVPGLGPCLSDGSARARVAADE